MISFMPKNPHLAFAYVPFQKYENIYDTKKALYRGTVFQDLDVPFECSGWEETPSVCLRELARTVAACREGEHVP